MQRADPFVLAYVFRKFVPIAFKRADLAVDEMPVAHTDKDLADGKCFAAPGAYVPDADALIVKTDIDFDRSQRLLPFVSSVFERLSFGLCWVVQRKDIHVSIMHETINFTGDQIFHHRLNLKAVRMNCSLPRFPI